MRAFIVFLSVLLLTPISFAQKIPAKNLFRSGIKPYKIESGFKSMIRYVPPSSAAGMIAPGLVRAEAAGKIPGDNLPPADLAPRLERVLARQVMAEAPVPQPEVPSLAQTEKYIRQSLVEVIGRATGELMGSGFVVRSGAGNLYAVVSYHVVGRKGNTVSVRMYNEKGAPVVYNGLIVNVAGSYGINARDAAIIALPTAARAHVRPLKVAHTKPVAGTELVVWGSPYASNGFARVDELKVTLAQGVKIVMDSPDVSEEFNGLCGSPVLDAQGQVVGIYSGHDPQLGLVFAVDARPTLEWLIESYEENKLPEAISLKAKGREVVKIQAEETIGWVYHFTPDGTLLQKVYLPKYPGEFDPEHVERLFQGVERGDFLELEIVKHRFKERTVTVAIL